MRALLGLAAAVAAGLSTGTSIQPSPAQAERRRRPISVHTGSTLKVWPGKLPSTATKDELMFAHRRKMVLKYGGARGFSARKGLGK